MANIFILGSGGFGTALAVMAHKYGQQVTLWSAFQEEIDEIRFHGENKKKLPGVAVDLSIDLTSDITGVKEADIAIIAVPSFAIRSVAGQLADVISPQTIVVNVGKGLEADTLKRFSEVIAEELPDGRKIVRFEPVSAWETPGAMESLCDAFQTAAQDAELDPLLLIPIFILDFLCIHPFNEGNGRMNRLLILLLLYRSGYLVGKYISIEKLISDTKETYYEALQESSCNWHEGTNDYAPFVTYMLGILAAAYRDFESRIELLTTKGLSKPDRVREIIRNHLGKITKSEIMAKCPDISQITVQRALAELLKSGEIIKLSGGRYTAYVWNGKE